MRNILFLLIILTIACKNSQTKNVNDLVVTKHLDSLAKAQDYFKLRQSLNSKKSLISKELCLYYEAIVLNLFNDLSKSNSKIEELLSIEPLSLTDTMLNKLYYTKILNHINLYEYKQAKEVSELILKNYSHLNDSSKVQMLENELNIWKSLENIPTQEIEKNSDVSFPMTKDKVGLFNIDVSINHQNKHYIFDTGANISVIKRSLVKELGLTYIESDFYVTAFTGEKVDSDLAIANELMIGDLTFKNVVFLVLDDEDISFPQIEYYINGIIGFPVIEAMDEVRISKNNTIFTPKDPIDYKQENFALDGLTPIIAINYKKDTLSFSFDTGARTTSLYAPFYRKYQDTIEKNYTPQALKSGSAGGIVEFDGFLLDSLVLSVGNSSASLKSIRVHKNDIKGDVSNFYGNLGQDFIKQFDEMIISFKYGSVVFK
ncbi:retropepsin-like aspartic protease family protein [Seonamhaeicola aphaedonensis]|uniref:Aspartyl protease n=1 Tax=Seonamhaeicola aphaedonensis TaxID=1461338 RepID=A0A3D9HJC6_9FLAO|nr:retropepsin-like aspartic protease [Seonamhaeicola aphaedonensis]RED49016.1 aspartyl protease [Seonamhaeicola aphaedonensis]